MSISHGFKFRFNTPLIQTFFPSQTNPTPHATCINAQTKSSYSERIEVAINKKGLAVFQVKKTTCPLD